PILAFMRYMQLGCSDCSIVHIAIPYSCFFTFLFPSSFFFPCSGDPRDLHSFPTRRSSDLGRALMRKQYVVLALALFAGIGLLNLDRKSTRLNSSHVKISYAVFCLKKKNYEPQVIL